MTRKSGKQADVDALVCQPGYERAPAGMAGRTCQAALCVYVEEQLAHGVWGKVPALLGRKQRISGSCIGSDIAAQLPPQPLV